MVLVLGGAALHLLLRALWPDRPSPGLLPLLALEEPAMSTGSWVILPWLLIFLVAISARFGETRSLAFRSLGSGGLADLGWIFVFYLAMAGVGGWVENGLDYHFATSIGIYGMIATSAFGMAMAGRRWPFRTLTLAPLDTESSRRCRRRANLWLLMLVPLLYLEWIFDKRVWAAQKEMPGWQWTTVLVALSVPCLVLAWAILHSTPVTAAGRRLVSALETRAAGREEVVRSPWMVGLLHTLAAALVLVLLRASYLPVEAAWTADTWVFPRGHEQQVFLGVDWYFTSVREWLEGAEIFVLLSFATIVPGVTSRLPSLRGS